MHTIISLSDVRTCRIASFDVSFLHSRGQPNTSHICQILLPSAKYFSHLPNTFTICQILLTSAKYFSHLPNTSHICQILLTSAKYFSHLPNTSRICQILLTSAKYFSRVCCIKGMCDNLYWLTKHLFYHKTEFNHIYYLKSNIFINLKVISTQNVLLL